MRYVLVFSLFVFLFSNAFSQDSLFDIGILRSQNLKTITITVQTDGYDIIINDSINKGALKKGDQVKFALYNDSVQVSALNGVTGVYRQVALVASDTSAWFK